MTNQDSNIHLPSFSVKRIKTVNFFLDESGLPTDALYRVDFKHQFHANSSADLVALELEVIFTLDNKEDNSKNKIVLDCTVQNVFEIQGLSNFIEGTNNVRLPNETIISFVSLSVSHTRAIMAMLTAGTFFQENLLPIINPVEMAKAFFPEYTSSPNIKPEDRQEIQKMENIELAPTSNADKFNELAKQGREISDKMIADLMKVEKTNLSQDKKSKKHITK